MSDCPKIAVVGAGINGIATALRILQTLPKADVTIFAARFSPNTTSDVAAGFWGPYNIGDTPEERLVSWSRDTYNYLTRLAKADPQSAACGIFLSPGFELHSVENPVIKSWSRIPIGFRMASREELAMFPSRFKSGFFYINAVVEGTKFMPHLTAQLQSLGGKLEHRQANSFSELQQIGYRHIVNCSGLGAMKLCNDQAMFPIRGQVHRVSAPWLKFWFDCDDCTYCLLNANHAVLGGVAQRGNWDSRVSEEDKAAILARNYDVWPALRKAPLVADLVGLRPGRDRVRLERQTVSTDMERPLSTTTTGTEARASACSGAAPERLRSCCGRIWPTMFRLEGCS